MKKNIFLILIVTWMAFIFSMSSQNSEVSSNTSGGAIRIILSAVPQFNEQSEEAQEEIVEELQFITRKSAHFIAYMILGILATSLTLKINKINKKPQFALLICVLYAISDEIHQLFVPGRSSQFRDVLIDSAGSCVGIGVVLLVVKLLHMRQNKKNRIKSE